MRYQAYQINTLRKIVPFRPFTIKYGCCTMRIDGPGQVEFDNDMIIVKGEGKFWVLNPESIAWVGVEDLSWDDFKVLRAEADRRDYESFEHRKLAKADEDRA